MSYETVVCMRIPGHDGWTQWVGEEAGSSNKLGSARLGHPASHEGAPTVSGFMDSYCPHQCAIWAWNTDTQNWVKDCVRPGWTVAGEYTYPSPMNYETVVCMRDYGHDGWTQWVPEEAGSSNKLGTARLGHPASHEGAPTVSGFMDSYCPHQCAIWAWNTDTQNWVKDCVRAGWTVAGEYTYPNPMSYETVVCMRIPDHDGWTQWVGEEAGSSNKQVGDYVDLYIPRKCSASNRIIAAKDHASIQINICDVDETTGRMTSTYKTYAICGAIRRMGESDDCINRLAKKDGVISKNF